MYIWSYTHFAVQKKKSFCIGKKILRGYYFWIQIWKLLMDFEKLKKIRL